MQELVSVCLLTRNNWEQASRCIESLQPILARPDVGLYVLDNGSDAATREWVFCLPDNIYKRYQPSNLGVAGGRSVLFGAARGQFILSLDSDAAASEPEGSLAKFLEVMDRPRVGIAGPRGGYIRSDWTGVNMYPEEYHGPAALISGVCQFFRRSLLEECSIDIAYSPYWHEDVDFCMQINKLGLTGYQLNVGIVHQWNDAHEGEAEKWAYFVRKWRG